jgi:hypothetical protein
MNESILAALSGVNYELVEHLKWLLERKDLDALSRVAPQWAKQAKERL